MVRGTHQPRRPAPEEEPTSGDDVGLLRMESERVRLVSDDIPSGDVQQAIEDTRNVVESQPVAEAASHTEESFDDFPEALDDDVDNGLPF